MVPNKIIHLIKKISVLITINIALTIFFAINFICFKVLSGPGEYYIIVQCTYILGRS